APGALAIGAAADHEPLAALALDLEPVARAAAPIRPVRLLRDDALEVVLVAGTKEFLAALLDVRAVDEDAVAAGNQPLEELLAFAKRHVAEIVTLELETAEEHSAHGDPPPPD